MQRIDPDEVDKWIDELNRPPAGKTVPVDPRVVEEEMALFRRAQGVLK